MKKLMKKKVNMFGKSVPVFVFVLVGMMAFGSAMLVPYLSNTISGDVTVTSPITLEVQTGATIDTPWDFTTNQIPSTGWADGSFTPLSGVGGMTENVWIRMENNADTHTDQRYLVMEFTNNEGLTVAEVLAMITGVTVYDWDHANMQPTVKQSGVYNVGDLIVTSEGSNTVRVAAPTWLWADDTGEKDTVYADVDLAFALNAHGTYEFKAAVLITSTSAFA